MTLDRLRIFISSPGDVAEERVIANRLVRRLSDEYLDRVFIEPVFWEHEPLLASGTFQKQIPPPSECQVAICILWSRLGTRLPADITRADGSRYASGTEYEFEDALNGRENNGYPDLLVYRKTSTPMVSLDDDDALERRRQQKKALDAFIQKWFFNADGTLKAAFHQFENTSQFELILEEHLRKLILRRLPVGSAASPAVVKPSWTAGSPFRGLDVFDFQHAPVFFGRTQAAADVLGSLRKNAAAGRAFVLIVGVSGGGKSSLARAGVLPVLIQPGVIEGVGLWRRAILKPSDAGGDLLRALASSLLAPEALPELAADGTTAGQLADLLRDSAASAFALVKGALSQAAARLATDQRLAHQPEARLVLLVDQLEELFTLRNLTPKDREAFVAVLSSLARSGKVWVIATLRGDFYHRLFEVPELGALKEGTGQYDLPLPAPAEIAQMIRMPARAAGLTFEEDSATHVPLDDVVREAASSSPESLPLLEFALEELYQRRTPQGVLSYSAYKDLGGVEGALARRADMVFDALPAAVQDCLPRVMRGLVSIGPSSASTALGTGAAARQQAALTSVAPTAETQAFVEAFVQARLFTADRTQDGKAVVRVTHEALLRNWPRIIKWLEQDRELLIVRARVSSAAARWEREGRRSDLLLGEGKPLAEAEALAATLGDELRATEHSLIAMSRARRQRVRAVRRGAVGSLIVLTLVAAFAAAVAQRQQKIAAENAQRAAAGEQQANRARHLADELANDKGKLAAHNGKLAEDNRSLADNALRVASATDQRIGHLLMQQGNDAEALAYEARALKENKSNENALVDSVALLYRRPVPKLVLIHDGMVKCASFSPDGKRISTACQDGTTQVWDASMGRPLGEPMPHNGIRDLAFSSDGTRMVTVSVNNTTRVWDVATGKPMGEPMEHQAGILCAAFSPDGARVVITSSDGSAQVWDAATGQPLDEPMRPEGPPLTDVGFASFSPDGTRLVTPWITSARMWDVATGKPQGEPLEHGGTVWAASFSPDGTRVLTASLDKTARLWDAATGKPVGEPMRHEGNVRFAAFSPDGTRVVTASEDKTARIWDAATGQPLGEPMRHAGNVLSGSFSADGTRVVTVSNDRAARVWDAATARLVGEPMRHEGDVSCASFSPDGTRVVTASKDKTVRIWDAAPGKPLGEPMRHQGPISSASFSPDGTRVVTASLDKTARLWDAATGKPMGEPMRHEDTVNSAAFSPDGSRVVTASGTTARVWDAATGKPLGEPMRHEGLVNCASFSPDGARLLTASADGIARVWDAATGEPRGEPMRNQDAIAYAWLSPDGARVVTVCFNNTARAWDPVTGKPLGKPTRQDLPVRFAWVSPYGTRMAMAERDDTAQIGDARSGQPLGEPMRHKRLLGFLPSFSFDGTRVITAVSFQEARIWDVQLPPDQASQIIAELDEMAAGRRLSEGDVSENITGTFASQLSALRDAARSSQTPPLAARFAGWVLADPRHRAVSPLSSRTVAEWVQDRVDENTPETLQAAWEVDPDNTLCLARRARLFSRQNPQDHVDALLYIRLARQRAPQDPEVAWREAAVLALLGRLNQAMQAASTCPQPRDDDMWGQQAKSEACTLLHRPADAAAAGQKAKKLAEGRNFFVAESLVRSLE